MLSAELLKLKSGDVVIPSFENSVCLAGQTQFDRQNLQPFSTPLVETVASLSAYLLASRPSPEIVAFAYWCRRSQLLILKESYASLEGVNAKVFHITPANVDTVYMYSFVLSFLVGNYNIVRLSERRGALSDEFVHLVAQFMQQDAIGLLQSRTALIAYPATHHDLTRSFSEWCDIRVVWGGDETIERIQAIQAVDVDVCFPDRFSVALLHVASIQEAEKAARLFCADFYPFLQQACSSPKAIFWLNTTKPLQETFWQRVLLDSETLNPFAHNHKLNRYINLQTLLINDEYLKVEKVDLTQAFLRVKLSSINSLNFLKQHNGNGLVFESDLNVDQTMLSHRQLQTISYFGLADVAVAELEALRKVPLGMALSFNHIWDGIDLVQALVKSDS